MENVDIDLLRKAFSKSWSRETSYPRTKHEWRAGNPAFGQCAVTSLVVNDLLGGRIVFNKDYNHFWNILDDGTVVDLTKVQFRNNVNFSHFEDSDREYILHSDAASRARTLERYRLLKKRIEKYIPVPISK